MERVQSRASIEHYKECREVTLGNRMIPELFISFNPDQLTHRTKRNALYSYQRKIGKKPTKINQGEV